MERGPLPPHERTWRHPSELAADESAAVRADRGGRQVRIIALAAGTFGLLAIGALALMVTPSREDPIAIGSSAALVAPTSFGPATTALLGVATTELGGVLGAQIPRRSTTTHPVVVVTTSRVRQTATTPPATLPDSTSTGATPITTTPITTNPITTNPITTTPATAAPTGTASVSTIELYALAALATPLESGLALVTARSVQGHADGDEVAVRLASGRTAHAQVVTTIGRAVVVAVVEELAGERWHRVADDPLDAHSLVTVLLTTPITVTLAELARLDVPEGTAVVDADGELVGLCTDAADGSTDLALIDPSADDVAPSGNPATSQPTGSVPTSAPATTPATDSTTTTVKP